LKLNFFRKKQRYSFIKRISPGAREATLMSTVSLGILILTLVLSFAFGGKAGLYIGALGLVGMLTAFYGLYLGMKALSDIGMYKFTAFGTVFAGIMSIIWLGMLVLGIG